MNAETLRKLQEQKKKASSVLVTAKTTVETEKLEATTPVVDLEVKYQEPREIFCASNEDVTKHIPCLATSLHYKGSILKSNRKSSFSELVTSAQVEVWGRKAIYDTAKGEYKQENGNLVFEDQESRLMGFIVMWDQDRNRPPNQRSEEIGINLIPGQGVPRENVIVTTTDGRKATRKYPDWKAMSGLQSDITAAIRNCEEPLSVIQEGKATTPMGLFVSTIRDAEQKTQASASSLEDALKGATTEADVFKKDQ